jgi:hypothetical protein
MPSPWGPVVAGSLGLIYNTTTTNKRSVSWRGWYPPCGQRGYVITTFWPSVGASWNRGSKLELGRSAVSGYDFLRQFYYAVCRTNFIGTSSIVHDGRGGLRSPSSGLRSGQRGRSAVWAVRDAVKCMAVCGLGGLRSRRSAVCGLGGLDPGLRLRPDLGHVPIWDRPDLRPSRSGPCPDLGHVPIWAMSQTGTSPSSRSGPCLVPGRGPGTFFPLRLTSPGTSARLVGQTEIA